MAGLTKCDCKGIHFQIQRKKKKKKKKKGKTYCQRRLVAWLHIKFKYRAGLEIFFSHSKLLLRLIANEALNISRKWYESDDNIGMYDVIYYNSVSYRLKLIFCWRGYTNVIYGAVWLLLEQASCCAQQAGDYTVFLTALKMSFLKVWTPTKMDRTSVFCRWKPVVNFGKYCINFNKLGLYNTLEFWNFLEF